MLIGFVANDRMFVVLDRFFKGEISDEALIHSFSALKLGKKITVPMALHLQRRSAVSTVGKVASSMKY